MLPFRSGTPRGQSAESEVPEHATRAKPPLPRGTWSHRGVRVDAASILAARDADRRARGGDTSDMGFVGGWKGDAGSSDYFNP